MLINPVPCMFLATCEKMASWDSVTFLRNLCTLLFRRPGRVEYPQYMMLDSPSFTPSRLTLNSCFRISPFHLQYVLMSDYSIGVGFFVWFGTEVVSDRGESRRRRWTHKVPE